MEMTITLPEQLGQRLSKMQDAIPELLTLGLERWTAKGAEKYEGVADVLEKMAQLPAPEQVLELRPSEKLQSRISELLEKNRDEGLGAEEEQEWQHYEHLEHVVRMAKARAALKLSGANDA